MDAKGERPEESAKLAEAAREAGLRMVAPDALDIRRRRCGRGFLYVDERSRRITDPATIARLRSLAVPPAYEDVLLASDPRAHLQAIGRDDAGRLQYRYHPEWEAVREGNKVERLGALCAALPHIRRRVARDLRRRDLVRERVLAGVVALIDRTHIRIGCEDYVHSGRSRGAATLLKRNVRCEGDTVRLTFRGKGGRPVDCDVTSRPLRRLIEELQQGRHGRLFCYRGADGKSRRVTAADTNAYLRQVAEAPITAKDFRTLAATAAAAERLASVMPAGSLTGRRRQLKEIFVEIAGMLGNTPAVTQKSYVHRRLVDAFHEDDIRHRAEKARRAASLSRGEVLVASLFRDSMP